MRKGIFGLHFSLTFTICVILITEVLWLISLACCRYRPGPGEAVRGGVQEGPTGARPHPDPGGAGPADGRGRGGGDRGLSVHHLQVRETGDHSATGGIS